MVLRSLIPRRAGFRSREDILRRPSGASRVACLTPGCNTVLAEHVVGAAWFTCRKCKLPTAAFGFGEIEVEQSGRRVSVEARET